MPNGLKKTTDSFSFKRKTNRDRMLSPNDKGAISLMNQRRSFRFVLVFENDRENDGQD
jgi:hypothetical protein